MPLYLVETYVPRGRKDTLPPLELRAATAATKAELNGAGVRFVRSLFVPEDEIWFRVYEAADSESVERASRLAGIPVERVVEAVDPGDATQATPSVPSSSGPGA